MYCDWPLLGRCCLCLPLRKGLLAIGYLSILYSSFMIGVYSYGVHNSTSSPLKYFGHLLNYGRKVDMPEEMCIALYCAQLIFDAVLIYGAHMKVVRYIKVYYCFALTTTAAVVVMQIIGLLMKAVAVTEYNVEMYFALMTFTFIGFCMQLYVITIVRSFLKKMESSEPQMYDNQLQTVTTGDCK